MRSAHNSDGDVRARHQFETLRPAERLMRGTEIMSTNRDDIKDNIDKGAEKAKDATDKTADKAKDTARKSGEKLKDAGDKLKHSMA